MKGDIAWAHGQREMGACPECDMPSHIQASVLTRPRGKSGQCLAIGLVCEEGHRWIVTFDDHSGGLWISAHMADPSPKGRGIPDL